eukprot:1361391-Amorphochlora_amoeboformis.AAC.1
MEKEKGKKIEMKARDQAITIELRACDYDKGERRARGVRDIRDTMDTAGKLEGKPNGVVETADFGKNLPAGI